VTRNAKAKAPENKLAGHGFSEKLRKAFNDSSVKDVQLTRDEAGSIFLRMAQLEAQLFGMAVKAK